jgi:hypothetical protein
MVAGRVGSSGRLVTVRCGGWRVTHMPMEAIDVRAGVVVRQGARLGRVGPSDDHAGLHLGVRREGQRFGYVDPLRFMGTGSPAPPPAIAPRRVDRPHPPRPPNATRRPPNATRRPPNATRRPPNATRRVPNAARRPAHPRAEPAARRVSATPPASLAPWPAWAGLALVLAGAGLRWRRPPAASLRRPRWRSTSPPRSTT